MAVFSSVFVAGDGLFPSRITGTRVCDFPASNTFSHHKQQLSNRNSVSSQPTKSPTTMGLDFLNSIPIVGHWKAAVEAITGDTDAARRTVAAATGGLVSTVGAVGGFVVGGPPGAIAGGGLGNMIGGQIERKINGQDLDLSAGKLLTDAAIGGAAGAVGGGGAGNAAKGLAQGLGRELSKDFVRGGAGSIGKTIAAEIGQQLIK